MTPVGMRRSGRIPKEIPIVLIGSDTDGRSFAEETKTVVLSRYGAGIASTHKLFAEDEVVVRRPESRIEIEARVVGQIGAEGETHFYGVAFVNADLNFWGIDFPPISDSEHDDAHQRLFVCSSCQTLELVNHTDMQSDVYAVNEGLFRFCKSCGLSTLWKYAPDNAKLPAPRPAVVAAPPAAHLQPPAFVSTEATPQAPSLAASSASAGAALPVPVRRSATAVLSPPAESKPQVNRRKHVRAKVNFMACVRCPELPDDVVNCEDMSRGGLRFKSKRKYPAFIQIEVAAPYVVDSYNIFETAQIVFAQELPEQQKYRYGVQYLKSYSK